MGIKEPPDLGPWEVLRMILEVEEEAALVILGKTGAGAIGAGAVLVLRWTCKNRGLRAALLWPLARRRL